MIAALQESAEIVRQEDEASSAAIGAKIEEL